jgi:hypothetical protein
MLKKFKPVIAAEISPDMAACEFDCRELDCSEKDWQSCPRRLQKAEAIRALEQNDTAC